ncbi:MAG: hypothetical protein ACQEQS_09620 [Thermodesulfobacteriota bacterium]
MYKFITRFPDFLEARFMKIPDPEKQSIIEKAGIDTSDTVSKPDEDDIYAFEEAIRYKESKVQLIRLMLEGMIEDDLNDRLEAIELAAELINSHPLSEVIGVYEEKYR